MQMIRFAQVSAVALATGLLMAGQASALTLNTSGLKANSVLSFTPAAIGAFTAAKINLTGVGNMTRLADRVTVDENGLETTAPVFNQPVTKAEIKIGWDLKITPVNGEAAGSALQLVRGAATSGVVAYLANFHVDFTKQVLSADLISKDATGAFVTSTKMPLYNFVETVPQKISFKGFVLNQTVQIGKLMFTTEAQQQLGDALKVSAVLRAALAELDNGTLDIQITSYKRDPKLVLNRPFTVADIPQ